MLLCIYSSSYYGSLVAILFVQKEIKLIKENATPGKPVTGPAIITRGKVKVKLQLLQISVEKKPKHSLMGNLIELLNLFEQDDLMMLHIN